MTNLPALIILGLCFHALLLSIHAWGPANLVSSKAFARKLTASFIGVSVGVSSFSSFVGIEKSFAQTLTTESVFVGKYNDPNHPGCLRKIDVNGKDVTILGSDDIESNLIWTLKAKEEKAGEILVDFSPKGGPKDLLGVYSQKDNGIKWPDGNIWSKQ